MKRAPDPAAIREVELRFAQSSQNVLSSLCRARIALNTTMSQTSTYLKVAGVAGVFLFMVTRGKRSTYPGKGLLGALWTSARGLALARIVQIGITKLETLVKPRLPTRSV